MPYRICFLGYGKLTEIGRKVADYVRADIRFITIVSPEELLTLEPSLRYKLGVFQLRTSPLKNRKEDIPALFELMLTRYHQFSRKRPKLSPAACELISVYHWPGNIYELTAVCERYLRLLWQAISLHRFRCREFFCF